MKAIFKLEKCGMYSFEGYTIPMERMTYDPELDFDTRPPTQNELDTLEHANRVNCGRTWKNED